MITRTINHLLGAFGLRLCPISKPEWGFLNTIAMVVLIEPVAELTPAELTPIDDFDF